MVYRILIILLAFYFNTGNSKIIYDKYDIYVTQLELSNYQELYKKSYNEDLKRNKALKDIILMKNTINFLLKNNPEFINALDEKITINYKKINFESETKKNFFRFQTLRNEFINDYFQNQFDIEKLKIIFSSLIELKLPISKNNCLTIEGLKELNKNDYFIKSFYQNFKINEKKYKTKINEELFDVCINNKQLNFLEKVIIDFVEQKTENDFNRFIYGKLNWKKSLFSWEMTIQLI